MSDADVRVHLRRSRTVRVSIDANGDYCRQLLAERYPEATPLDPR